MNAANREPVGTFSTVHLTINNDRRFLPQHHVHVSAHGISFRNETYIPPFTELQVRIQLPHKGETLPAIQCHGVVVDCRGTEQKNQYEVSIAFLNVPVSAKDKLRQSHSRSPSRSWLRTAHRSNPDRNSFRSN